MIDMNNPVAMAQELARTTGQRDELLKSLRECVHILTHAPNVTQREWDDALEQAHQAIDSAKKQQSPS